MYFLISRYFILLKHHLGLTQARQSPTLMLFLKMYPGSEKPFFLSIGSLKITSCSKRKTRLSFARERKLLSCSVTVKVSCWSSLPWAVIFPCTAAEINTIHRASGYVVAFTGLIVGLTKRLRRMIKVPEKYLKALKSAHIHHVIATFWHKAHHFNCFLFERQ